MSDNAEELNKIINETSGWFKGAARSRIRESIRAYRPRIEAALREKEETRRKSLVRILNEVSSARNAALSNGAKSYSHPEWAAAAVCESWLYEILSGTPEGLATVSEKIQFLENRK